MKQYHVTSAALVAVLTAGIEGAMAQAPSVNNPGLVGAPPAALPPSAGSYNSSQPSDTKPSASLEQITVTAQKRVEKLQNVPVSVTAFSAKQLENTQVRDISDLSSTVPNFQISTGGSGPGASVISLRGLSFQDIEKSFEPPIGLVVDGVYLSTSTGQVAQAFDFNRVEVLAGPQGTLFGKNTTGGVINITRSKPDPSADDISGKIRLTGGNFGEHDGEAVVSIPVIKDVLALKFAAFSQNNDGAFKDPTIGHNLGARDYQSFSGAADWRPNPDSDVYVIFDRTLDHSQLNPLFAAQTPDLLPLSVGGFVDGHDTPCFNPFIPGACSNPTGKAPPNVSLQDREPNAGYNLYAATVNAYYNFDAFKLVSVTGYRSSNEESENDYDATQYPLYNTNRPEYYRQISQEVRVESNFTGPFNIVGGAYYFDSDYTLREYADLNLAAVAPVPLTYGNIYPGQYTHQASMNEAVFFQGTYDITSKLRLIFGARQSWDQKTILYSLYTDSNLSSFGPPVPGETGRASHSWSQFTPKAGIEYRVNPNLMTYFTYSKGYNSGGFNGRAGTLALIGPYAPEQVHAFEIGAKSTWLNNRLRVNVAGFYNLFFHAQEEIIQQGTGQLTSTTVANAANATFRGFEIEAAGKPSPDLTLAANVGYLNSFYYGFNAALLAGPPTDNDSLTVRRTPPWTVGFNADEIIPVGRGDIGLDLNMKYVAHQQFDLLNDPRGFQGPVTKLDLSARYDRKIAGIDWTLTGFVKNVTNETPKNAFVTGYQGSFIEFWSEEIGRTYGVTLEAKF